MDETLKEFLIESNENTEKLINYIVELETHPKDPEILRKIFRIIHTLKGTSGFFGLKRIEDLSHIIEDVLAKIKEGSAVPAGRVTDVLLKAADTIRAILKGLETEEKEPPGEDTLIKKELKALQEEKKTEAYASAAAVLQNDNLKGIEGDSFVPPVNSVSSRNIRIDVSVLDKLMNSAGELVLIRNRLFQMLGSDRPNSFTSVLQELNHLTISLQDAVMQTRMREIGHSFNKLGRIIRDLSVSCGKKIHLNIEGADTELDRQILETIEEPFIHMVRNSIDHGIESPSERIRAGKQETGNLSLKARHEGGFIVITIADDGRGIDAEKVRQKVIEKGLIKAEESALFSDSQILEYIFKPGFTTAEKISSVSGRGVGMDIVKAKIEAAGGSVSLHTVHGKGTEINLKFPLTLAIMTVLIVSSGNLFFALPEACIVELAGLNEEKKDVLDCVRGAPVLKLRNEIIPLFRLDEILNLKPAIWSDEVNIVILEVNKKKFGLIADAIFDTAEIVVKPLSKILAKQKIYSAATILGDGRIIMIIDPLSIAAEKGFTEKLETEYIPAFKEISSEKNKSEAEREKLSLLVFNGRNNVKQAVPIALISRLEEFKAEKIKAAGDNYISEYHDGLITLVPADSALNPLNMNPVPVIIIRDGSFVTGIMVYKIIDIVEDLFHLEQCLNTEGVMGLTSVNGEPVEIIDVNYYFKTIQEKPQIF